ncbi:MAG: hypothetical protein ACKVVT_14060 [Dehalococcoidia bacterium]
MSGPRPGDEVLDLVCDLGAITGEGAAEHRRALSAWSARVSRTTELVDGFAFELPVNALEDVARFIGFERRCCAFLTFSVTVSPGERLEFAMIGPPGAKEVLLAAAPQLAQLPGAGAGAQDRGRED